MANPVIKGHTAVWGVGSIYTGLITRASRKKNGETEVIYDSNGFVITKIFFDDKQECEIELIFESGTTEPTRGDAITFNSQAGFLVENTELMWEQRGWKKLKIQATFHVNIDLS